MASVSRGTSSGREGLTILLLLFGGFLVGIGWLIGVFMLWRSSAWTVTDKLVGTLIIPGGLATSAFLVGVPVHRSSTALVVGLGVVVVAPIAAAIFLHTAARRSVAPA